MLNWVLSTSLLIVVILLLRHVLRNKIDPRLTYALWLLVALRILVPASFFSLPVSVATFTQESGLSQAAEEVREAVSPKSVLTTSVPADSDLTMEEIGESWSDRGLQVYEVRPYTEDELAEIRAENPNFYQNTDSRPLRMTVETLVGNRPFWNWVYLAGCFVTLSILSWANRDFHKRVKQYRRPYEGELPVPCPLPVYVMSSLPSPCLYQMFRTAIYLNNAAVESDHLDHILTHELVHYRHKDHWWAAVRILCLCVQWFNPLVWLAAYLSRQDCELACDASVIRILGEGQRLSYGKTLVDMIAAGRRPGAFLQPATTMTDGKKGITQRIQLIAKRPKMTAVTLVAVLLIASVTAACTFGGATQKKDSPALEEYFGTTYVMAGESVVDYVQPIAVSYSPSKASIGEITITENYFGCFDEVEKDWGRRITTPVYKEVDFDPSAYGESDRFYPALDDFFGGYESITVYEIENASKPLHLLILDGELWMAMTGGYIFRLEEYVAPPESGAPENTAALPTDLSASELAQSVYAAIVGTDDRRDFYMVIYDSLAGRSNTPTRIHITAENDWNLPNNVDDFDWAYAEPCDCITPITLTIASADGQTWLRSEAGHDQITVHVNGQNHLLSGNARGWEGDDALLYTRLLRAAEDALLDQAYPIVITGSISDYEKVVEEYARQYAANLNNLPDWVPSKPEETVYRSSSVSQAYFGEGTENFCSSFGFYLSPEMGNSVWQAGSGMEEETEGEYAGWWKWDIGADFSRNSDSDWYCSNIYSGGAFLEFPTPLRESTMEQLVYYFYYTSGMNHDYLIPYYICLQPVSAVEELNRLLGELDDPAALCKALGAFLRDYGDYDDIQLSYDVLSTGLDSKFRPALDEGYIGTPE